MGQSGCGKTALMSKLASEVYLRQQKDANETIRNRPVIIRFCGTSSDSHTGHRLLQSLAHHIRLCHRLPFTPTIENQLFEDAKKDLHNLLQQYRVVLFIDSLDQLSNKDLARSDLSFLTGVKPHEDTRIIVSTLPDSREVDGYYYGCEHRLKSAGVHVSLVLIHIMWPMFTVLCFL